MAYPFNHKEFVAMMEQYNLKSNSITIPEHTILNDLVTENRDCVYLLKSGILAGYIDFDNDKIYSISHLIFSWDIIRFSIIHPLF